MKNLEKEQQKKYRDGSQSSGSQLTRRNFLKSFGAAVGGGALLGLEPALANETTRRKLSQLKFLSNPDELDWRAVRELYYLKDEIIHMNTGTLGAMPQIVLDNLNANNLIIAEHPYPTAYDYPFGLYGVPGDPLKPGVHQIVADFLGATEDKANNKREIVITNCTTSGMSFVANGLSEIPEYNLKEGDEVLTTMHEHPGGLACWEILRDRQGITLTELPFSGIYGSKQDIVTLFANAITSKTKVMSFCHINYVTGLRMPVKELCQLARANNIISVVDGAHAIGMLDLDFHDLDPDFYACSPQKWLCAPPGVGVLYINDRFPTCDTYTPGEGWTDDPWILWPTVTEAYGTHNLRNKLENRGQRSSPNLVGIEDAIYFQNEIGKDVIEQRVMDLSAYAKARLIEIPGVELSCSNNPELSSGLTAFTIRDINNWGKYSKLTTKLKEYNIYVRWVSYQDTPGGSAKAAIRVSTHIYNNYDQIDYLCQRIKENLYVLES